MSPRDIHVTVDNQTLQVLKESVYFGQNILLRKKFNKQSIIYKTLPTFDTCVVPVTIYAFSKRKHIRLSQRAMESE